MLTQEEKDFIVFWKENRLRRKKFVKQLMIGLPMGVLFGAVIFINFFSGWYTRAQMVLNARSSLIPVLLVGIILIVVFVSVFSVRHKWDQHEQRYLELLEQEKREGKEIKE